MVSILRRTGVFIAISSLYFLVSFSIASATSWTQDGASWGSASQYMDFAINPSTYEKYVAYEDGSSMTVKRFDGTSWVVVGTAMFTDPSTGVGDISLAFNASTSEPYVAYSETHVNGEGYMTYTSPHVKRFDGSSWVDVGLPAIYATGVHAGADISLAFNPSTNEPYIAYERYIYTGAGYTHGGAIQRFDGSSWVYVGGGGDGEFYSGVGMMRDIELVFNPSTNEPYIAYIDYENVNSYELNMKRFDGSSWVYVGAPSFSVGSGKTTGTSFAFNPSTNQPYVAYADPGDFNNAYVMEFDGSTWSTVGTAGFNNGKGGGTRGLGLAFNPANNMPYVVYPGAVSKFNGTSWVLVGGTSLSATENDSLMSIVFDPSTNQPSVTSSRLAFSFSEPVDRVELPTASLPGEMYTGTQTTTLSTATAGASIYYTLDGSTPTASSNLYSGAISITSSTNLKAIAIKSGSPDSDVMSESYLISSWEAVGSEDFTPRTAQYIKIAFNPSTSEPYVSYMDFMPDASYKQSVKRFSTTTNSWEGVGAEGFHPQRADISSLAFNPDTNEPYLFLPGSASIVSRFDGSDWVQVGGSFGWYSYAYPTKLVFNPITNQPYVIGSYYDNGQGGRMTVKKFDGSSWATVGSEGISSTTVSNVDMVFDPITGEPYVSYAINECLPSCPAHSVLHVKKFDGSSWVDIVNEPDYSMASLAFEPVTNDLYLYSTQGLMRVNGASLESIAPLVSSSQQHKLIINPITHEIYLGYVEWPTFVGYLKKLVGSSWVTVGGTTLSSGDVQSVDFAFNPTTNEPYIAYTSNVSPYKATVKKFPMSQADVPVASPASGSFSSAQSVILSSVTSSSSIYYTIDGSTPTTNSNLYSGAISITASTTLRAIAVRSEYIDSSVMSESYFIQTATPVPSISGGMFSSTQLVYLSSPTLESIIYYTIDGSTPTISSTLYSDAISIESSITLKAIAIKSGIPDSAIMTETYTITPSSTPTVTTGSATSIAQTTVTLGGNITALGTTNVTERGIVYGATASYGATTSTTSASFSTGAYTEDLTGLTCGTTYHFSAYAVNSIGTDYGSDDTYTTSACDLSQTATPTASPAGSTYTEGKTVTLTSTTAGATIFYTTDGSTPATTTSSTYTTPLSASSTVTYKAIAWADGYTDSSIMTETYTITPSSTPTVTTGSATSIAQTTVTLGGNITALGTTNVTERGIVYGATASYGATTSTTSASFSTGAYTEDLTGLTCGTTYHFSAYAVNSIGTDYGSDDTYTTSACGAIATITSNSYTVSALGTSNETISNVPYGTAKAVFLSALTSGQPSQTRNSTAVNDPVTTGDVLVVTAEDGTTIVNYTLSVLSLTAEQVVPDGSGFATVNSTTPEVVITDLGSTASVTVSSGTSDATINLGAFIANGTGTIPAIQVIAQNAYNMSVEIPASTVVTSASTTWNGVLTAPTVTTITLPTESGITKALSTAIEVGFVGESLTFSKAVRLLIPNEAGKRVGYSVTSTFTEITDTCASDSQVTGDALSAGAECKIDVGSDLVIWTKHFTTFATYSQTMTSSSGGGGGGGGSSSSRRTTTTATTTSATSTATSTVSTNTSEIEQLLNLLAVLKAQLQALLKTTASSAPVSLTRNLELGMEGEDVRALQAYLNTHGYPVSQSGVGSLGNETMYFGPSTKSAVIKFQNAHASTLLAPINLTSGTGYVGEKTRALINGGSSAIAVASKPVAPPVTAPATPVVVPKTAPTVVQKPVAPIVQKPVVVSPPAVQTLKMGVVSDDVLKLQIFLNNNGFLIAYNGTGSLGNETTSFGIATEAAVMRYQNEYLDELGLTEATGIVDRVTRAHMGF